MSKRKDHHKRIIQASIPYLEKLDYVVTEFHTAQKMPRVLRGVPDLNIVFSGITWWVEIKPRYANYMRDQMSDLQWSWFHERRPHVGFHLRYAIVEDEDELLDWIFDKDVGKHSPYDCIRLGEYHLGRYEQWRRGR